MSEVELRRHLEECKRTGCTHMLLCVDRSEGLPEEFCVKVTPDQDVNEYINTYTRSEKLDTSVIEVYNMSMDLESQIRSEANVFNI